MLIENGKTEYVLLVPENGDVYIDFAVKTLNGALLESTGVTLPVVTEANGKFVSLGDTQALKELAPKIEYGEDGYSVLEANGNLYLFGESQYGAIWAVYGFLERTVGYRFFAVDEVRIEKREKIGIAGMSITETPSFPYRCSGLFYARQDLDYATGLKAFANYGTRLDGKNFWGAWAHNHVNEFVRLKEHYNVHPEWFKLGKECEGLTLEQMNADHTQLCLSNLEMRDEFYKRLIERIQKEDHAKYFLLGHEDNGYFCDCERCSKITKKIGKSGLYMDFINDMARRVEAWRKENAPERELYIGGFAYEPRSTIYPPVKKVNGEFVPVDPCVVAEDNVFMLFCPIGTPDHSRSVFCETNRGLTDIMDGWGKVCKRFATYLYYGSFRCCFQFIDGIYRFKDDFEYFKKRGVKYIFVEGNGSKGAISFHKMTLYVLTRLEWDITLNTDDLIVEFCDNYYKAASPFLKKYFYYLMDYHQTMRDRVEYLTGKKYRFGMCQQDTVPQGLWSLNAVYELSLMLDDADKAIDGADYNDTIKATLHDRIELERMVLMHVQLEYFNRETGEYEEMRNINAYPKEKILELCDRFERDVKKFGIKRINGDGLAMETIEGWRQRAIKTSRFWENRMNKWQEEFYKLSKYGCLAEDGE